MRQMPHGNFSQASGRATFEAWNRGERAKTLSPTTANIEYENNEIVITIELPPTGAWIVRCSEGID